MIYIIDYIYIYMCVRPVVASHGDVYTMSFSRANC